MQSADLQNAAQVMAGWARDIRQTFNVICVGIATLGTGSSDAPVAAMAMARSAAEAGKRVVLVDLARTASLIGGLAGVPAGPGLTDLISGTAAFTKVIARDTGSPAHILRYGLNHSPAATALINERLSSVLAALSQSYDLVLVNMGELSGDSLGYMQKCQAALLMTPPERQDDGAAVLQLLTESGLLAAQQVLIGQPAAQSFSPTSRAVNA